MYILFEKLIKLLFLFEKWLSFLIVQETSDLKKIVKLFMCKKVNELIIIVVYITHFKYLYRYVCNGRYIRIIFFLIYLTQFLVFYYIDIKVFIIYLSIMLSLKLSKVFFLFYQYKVYGYRVFNLFEFDLLRAKRGVQEMVNCLEGEDVLRYNIEYVEKVNLFENIDEISCNYWDKEKMRLHSGRLFEVTESIISSFLLESLIEKKLVHYEYIDKYGLKLKLETGEVLAISLNKDIEENKLFQLDFRVEKDGKLLYERSDSLSFDRDNERFKKRENYVDQYKKGLLLKVLKVMEKESEGNSEVEVFGFWEKILSRWIFWEKLTYSKLIICLQKLDKERKLSIFLKFCFYQVYYVKITYMVFYFFYYFRYYNYQYSGINHYIRFKFYKLLFIWFLVGVIGKLVMVITILIILGVLRVVYSFYNYYCTFRLDYKEMCEYEGDWLSNEIGAFEDFRKKEIYGLFNRMFDQLKKCGVLVCYIEKLEVNLSQKR